MFGASLTEMHIVMRSDNLHSHATTNPIFETSFVLSIIKERIKNSAKKIKSSKPDLSEYCTKTSEAFFCCRFSGVSIFKIKKKETKV